MINRYSVLLNGISLETLHDSIIILDVNYDDPARAYETILTAKRDGAIPSADYKEKAVVSIAFEIHEYDIAKRQSICQTVCAWAKKGGVLETNDRKGQFISCICETLPYIGSVKNWTDELIITFAAYAIPYWQEKTPSTVTLTGTSGSGNLYVPGSAPKTCVEATITANAALSSVSLTVENTTITLSNLSVDSGKSIVISYDDKMIQSIKADGVSILGKRTGADDLIAECGKINSVSFSSSASCSVTFSARGLWE